MVLVVDDDPNFLEQAMQSLNSGKGLFIARDAKQAKELMGCVGAAFSLVLIDLDLPGQDGFSLIHEMRAAFPDLPVIAISGVCQHDVLESAKLMGATAALSKPIDSAWNLAIAEAKSKH